MSDAITRLNAALEGRYRVERGIGEGGMATVYLAKDLKHNRNVALKVLKPDLAAVVGAKRFLAEIETTASLQHPHILPLFDSGEADTYLFYVMPYVEGESLQDRLIRDHQLPTAEAVRIATSVAEALDYAHRHGVIHRDVKPANVLLLDGKPVVADFGIALAAEGIEGKLTETGRSLGTPHYMSPEQATGEHNIGPPADVYGLGCVLYEMLIGTAPHTASTAQGVLAKILTQDAPSARKTRGSIPPNVDAAIRKALSPLPADRFQTAAAFATALAEPAFRYGDSPGQSRVGGSGSSWRTLAVGSVAGAGIALVAAMWLGLGTGSPEPPVLKVSLALSGEELVVPPNGSIVTVSPDGSTFLYGAFAGVGNGGRWQLWARSLDQFEATPLPGTEEGVTPAFSPDGTEVAFTRGGVRTSMQIVPLSGGPPRAVGDSVIRAGLDWGPDDMLYYVRVGHGLSRISSEGGPAEIVTTLDTLADETGHRWMDVLPDGRAAVFSISRSGATDTWDIGVVRFGESEHRVLTKGLYPRYAASGHLLWVLADGTLMAAPFDARRLELTGPAVVVMQDVNIGEFGAADYSVGDNGTLVFLLRRQLEDVPVWVGRDGTETEVDGNWAGTLQHPRLSPDGRRFLVGISEPGGDDIWIKDLERGPLSRLTFGSSNYRAEWGDGGRVVTFLSDQGGQGIWQIAADGSGSATLLQDDSRFINEAFLTADGAWLVYRLGSGGGRDLMARRIGGASDPMALATTPFEESAVRVSPDGQWIAYVSNESGQQEVYVRPFPSAGGSKQLVSTAGGSEPVWSPNGSELFYRAPSNQMVAVGVGLRSEFIVGERTTLFSTVPYRQVGTYAAYDVTQDGDRFLMIRSLGRPGEMKMVQNLFADLRRLAVN